LQPSPLPPPHADVAPLRPDRLDWDEGPDALRYPGLYDPPDPSRETDDEDDLEPLDLDDEDAIQ
jgi:hypothetical protein